MTAAQVLVIGRAGQLARALARQQARHPGLAMTFLGRPDLDVTDIAALRAAILRARPDILINASAYTAVDKAEDEPEAAYAVNRDAVAAMGAAAAEAGCPVIHVSTDYVFDGKGERPYRPDDTTAPQSVYGASKLAGEQALAEAQPHHVILRTSWVYSADGANFMNTMLRLAEGRDSLSVVDDQKGCPTVADDLAEAILAICGKVLEGEGRWGIFHYCGEGAITWFDFARAIFEEAKSRGLPSAEVSPTTTAAFGAKAPRPAYSLLDMASLTEAYGIRPKPWRAALSAVLDQRAEIMKATEEQESRQ